MHSATQGYVDDALARIRERGPTLLIGGEWHAPQSGRVRETVDPSSGEVIAPYAVAGHEDLALAVAVATAAQRSWAQLSAAERAESFARLNDLIAGRAVEIAYLDAVDAGLPVGRMDLDVRGALRALNGWPGLASSLRGEVMPDPSALLIQRGAAADDTIRTLSLELGGKNAMVVLPDVDVPQVATEVVRAMKLRANHGQSYDPASDMGPLIYAAHVDRVCTSVAVAVSAHADRRSGRSPCPLGGVLPRAHGADIGGQGRGRACVGRRSTTHYLGTPFGGWKNSGVGREESMAELRGYLRVKSVHVALTEPAAPAAAADPSSR